MKSGNPIPLPRIVSEAEWQAACAELLAKEKAATRARDALAAERRRQPMYRIEKDYVFDVYRTYFTERRGVEALGNVWSLLDLTPYGRQEEWEDSPPGWPQTPPYTWWRRHDEY